jgi:hypothetical protein
LHAATDGGSSANDLTKSYMAARYHAGGPGGAPVVVIRKVKQQAAQRSALRRLTRKLFKGSAELLFSHLVSDQKLTAKQIRAMRALLEEKSRKGET